MIEPAFKLRSIQLLDVYFGMKQGSQCYYEATLLLLELKSQTDAFRLDFAKRQYAFAFDLLFYDVTTLSFEFFDQNELCNNGFSKVNKFHQLQI